MLQQHTAGLAQWKKELISLCIQLVRSLLPRHIFSRDQPISFHWDDGALLDTAIQYTMSWALKAAKTSKTPNSLWKARQFWHFYMGMFCYTNLMLGNRWGTRKIFLTVVPEHLLWARLMMWQQGNTCAKPQFYMSFKQIYNRKKHFWPPLTLSYWFPLQCHFFPSAGTSTVSIWDELSQRAGSWASRQLVHQLKKKKLIHYHSAALMASRKTGMAAPC